MDGAIDWKGLEIIAELYGVTDIERFIFQLAMIRDSKKGSQ